MVLDLKTLITMQQTMLEQMSSLFESIGIEVFIDSIILSPKDCETEEGNYCIDYVWRIKCRDVFICNMLRQQIRSEEGGSGEEEGEEEEEEGGG